MLNEEQIQKIVTASTNYCIKKFSFLNWEKHIFTKIIEETLSSSTKSTTSKNFEEIFLHRCEDLVLEMVYLKIKFPEDIEVATQCIELIGQTDNCHWLQKLQKISNFLNKIKNKIKDDNDYARILTNCHVISEIVSTKIDREKPDKETLKQLTNNESVFSVIEDYSSINNIELLPATSILETVKDMVSTSDYSTIKTLISNQPHKNLTLEQSHELIGRSQTGDINARNILIEKNMGLITSIACRFVQQGAEFSDLIQEGVIGMMRAINKFDLEKFPDGSLSTYATVWIKQSIARYIQNTSNTIRIPVYQQENLTRINTIISFLENTSSNDPTYTEIAKLAGCSVAKVEELLGLPKITASFEAPLDHLDGKRSYLSEVIKDENAISPEENTLAIIEKEELEKNLGFLEPIEEATLKMRFGFDNTEEMTLQAIGDVLGRTREGVRLIEKRALTKIRKIYSDNKTLK